ncbi:histidine kinase dimerization/phospho-acceptor domain-containing protein [Agarilytica rhodophyticola]|uniref:histidine kinase dimerization/phospho-acceptor domain-containing protein n=1 Tax=Agarilytica rhodophyticola TaxID=1737490 RepID=UPI000B3497E8|nr:histidine kinase dimerization/phospho-acceptor domain-containing protein [Agarilytica rhodophyticola]
MELEQSEKSHEALIEELRRENLSLKQLLISFLNNNNEEELGRVFHDFNNILSSSMGYSSLALDRAKSSEDEKLSRYLENIERAGLRARDLVRDQLQYRQGKRLAHTLELNNVLLMLCPKINIQNDDKINVFSTESVFLYALSNLFELYGIEKTCTQIDVLQSDSEICEACGSELRGSQVRVCFILDHGKLVPSAHQQLGFNLAKGLINSYGGHLCDSLLQDGQYAVYLRRL